MRTVGKVFKKEEAKLIKKDIIAILREKEIEFDEKASVSELKALLPKE